MISTPKLFQPSHTLDQAADSIAHVFVRDAYLNQEQTPVMLSFSQLSAHGITPQRVHSVGSINGQAHFAVALADDFSIAQAPTGWRLGGLRSWFGVLDDVNLALAMKAVQVLEWERTHRFCGACGQLMQRVAHERSMQCQACKLSNYPRIAPAMMALVTRGDQLLLARGVNFPPGRYSALAGFLEAGESIEETVLREVREEVGVEVGNLQYFASQSWPFPNSLMIAFTAEWVCGDIHPDPAEIADAQWFSIDALPQLPPRLSIARALIETTIQRIRAS